MQKCVGEHAHVLCCDPYSDPSLSILKFDLAVFTSELIEKQYLSSIWILACICIIENVDYKDQTCLLLKNIPK